MNTRFDARWRLLSRRQRVSAFLAIFTFFALVGASIAILTVEPAHGADRICTHNPDGTCTVAPPKAAHKFRHHRYIRSHGFPAKRVWKNPKVARAVWVNKITRYLDRHPAKRRQVRHHLGAARGSGCTDRCLAYQVYGELMAGSNCVGWAYPTYGTHKCVYPGGAKITKRGIQRAGSLVICGGAVVIGVVGAAGSDGVATPAVVGMWGGLGCGWSFWASFG